MRILLADYMYKNNLTTRQVSIMTGIPKSTINKIANEQISPRLDTLELLAKGLKIHISDLYESDNK
uniref:Helix-turn-helix domain protein n=1 Tax=Siphoviridae sp. ctWDo30 TaxID=2826360 RepID=A0A8S5N4X3_9CAUD|nr:MAG TPA: helix-turn-helix domain protein [Siphoviridae sp. ctWDo30]